MDNDKIISITTNMDELDKDMYEWSILPYKIRVISDAKCREKYGCTNRILFNKMKYSILFNKPFKDVINIDNGDVSVQQESYFDYSDIDRRDLIMRIALAKDMNKDITISIIYPYNPDIINSDTDYKDSYIEEFKYLYKKFLGLNDKYQKYSNRYSVQLFGYNVRSMYQLIASDIGESEDSLMNIDTEYLNSNISLIEGSLSDIISDRNIVELFKYRLMSCRDSINEASTTDHDAKTINSLLYQYTYSDNYENSLNKVVPYFTISEFNSIIDNIVDKEMDKTLDNIESGYDYFTTICSLYEQFRSSNYKDIKLENQLLSLGWNPYVNPKNNMNNARQRQINWFNEYSCKLVDLSNIEVNNNDYIKLIESTSMMRDLYADNNLYPVYLITSYTNTFFGNTIRLVKSSTFTHAGIAIDSDLNNILTFMFDKKRKENGFMVESLSDYIHTYEDAKIKVLCFFVDYDTKVKFTEVFDYFTKNKSNTKYNFKNLINILRNKVKDNDPNNLSMVCSQFVDTVLKLCNIDLTHKSSNLVIPQDIANIKNPKVYILFDGLGKKYNETKIESKILLMLKSSNIEDIRYSDFVDKISESNNINLFDKRYNIIDNEYANKLLNEFYKYLLPVSYSDKSYVDDSDLLVI